MECVIMIQFVHEMLCVQESFNTSRPYLHQGVHCFVFKNDALLLLPQPHLRQDFCSCHKTSKARGEEGEGG